MIKKLKLTLFIFATLTTISSHASRENNLSVGYAQTGLRAELSADGKKEYSKKPNGFNIKYRNEFDREWGVISSFTYTNNKHVFSSFDSFSSKVNYYSFNIGPTYRFNEYISAYGLIGFSHSKLNFKKENNSDINESRKALSYGVGVQFNPYGNIVIDTSYEQSKIHNVNSGTWVIGLGYQF